MTRLSFRPRPVDVNKKLAIVRSIKELDGEDGVVSRSVSHGHIALDADNEPVLQAPAKKGEGKEIPTPQCDIVANFDVLYPANFQQPETYVRRKPARAETEEFVEYDLDDQDEEWLASSRAQRLHLSPAEFELMLYRLELADARARIKAMSAAAAAADSGAPTPLFVLGVKVPVELQLPQAMEILGPFCRSQASIGAVFEFWKAKREKWGKPILRRLQPQPAVTDTNPFNVFRPREKVHRPNTRRMQRRENDVATYEKLLQVKKNLEDAQRLLAVLEKREETKMSLLECEFELQRAALQNKEIGRMYLEREAKRVKLQEAKEEGVWAAVTPSGLRLKVIPPSTSDLVELKAKDSSETLGRGPNGYHTPTVATKKRSTPSAGATAALAAQAASGGSLLPPAPFSRVRLPNGTASSSLEAEEVVGRTLAGSSVDVHQLQPHKRKRRRHAVPLRGAAAASAAAAATARLNSKHASSTPGAQALRSAQLLRQLGIKEPPRPSEPVMAFAMSHVNVELIKKHLLSPSKKELPGSADARPGPKAASEEQEKMVAWKQPQQDNWSGSRAKLVQESEPELKSKFGGEKQEPVDLPSSDQDSSPSLWEPFPGVPADVVVFQTMRGRPRIGRGGRLVFDRWNTLTGESLEEESAPGVTSTQLGTGPVPDPAVGSPASERTGKGGTARIGKGAEWQPVELRFAVHRHRTNGRRVHATIEEQDGGPEMAGVRGMSRQTDTNAVSPGSHPQAQDAPLVGSHCLEMRNENPQMAEGTDPSLDAHRSARGEEGLKFTSKSQLPVGQGMRRKVVQHTRVKHTSAMQQHQHLPQQQQRQSSLPPPPQQQQQQQHLQRKEVGSSGPSTPRNGLHSHVGHQLVPA